MPRSGRFPGTSCDYGDLGDRNDEFSAPGPDSAHLLDDLFLEVPRQDQQIIGLRLEYVFRLEDRDVSAGQKHSLLVRTPVDGVIDEIRADTAIVQERIALRGRPVGCNGLPALLCLDQELQELSLGDTYFFREVVICGELVEIRSALFGKQILDRIRDVLAAILDMFREYPQRAAMRRQGLHIEQG